MGRTIYETEEDLANEREIRLELEKKWNCKGKKLPKKSIVDFAMFREGEIVSFIEIKDRSKNQKRQSIDHKKGHPSLLISALKLREGKYIIDHYKKPFLLVVRFIEGIYYIKYEGSLDLTRYTMKVLGRKDRKDPEDIEPVFLIPKREFIPL